MKISRDLNKKDLEKILKQFYEYFENGFVFEDFLKVYFQKIGLDEVEVTKRTRDDGVDLKAMYSGIGVFTSADLSRYNIQAKRRKPGNIISKSEIQKLRGTLTPGYKGIFVTTSSFSKDAIKEAEALDGKRVPIVLIDGIDLVSSCIDNEIGFFYKPVFSEKIMDKLLEKNVDDESEEAETNIWVNKIITANDIRAKIISIPSAIMKKIPEGKGKIDVVVNDTNTYNCSVNWGRNYLGTVTVIFKDFSLVDDDGIITPMECKWTYDSVDEVIRIEIIGAVE